MKKDMSEKEELKLYREWIKKISQVCASSAKGDLEARLIGLPEHDEVNNVCLSINRSLDIADAFVREAGAALMAASEGKFYRKVLTRGMLGSFLLGARQINAASEGMERQAHALEKAEEERKQLQQDFQNSLNGAVEMMTETVGELNAAADGLVGAAAQTSEDAITVATISDHTARSVDSVANSTNELSLAINEIGKQVTESTRVAKEAVGEVDKSSTHMTELSEVSARIDGITDLITGVAGQTNLLALNATIEAARAGDAGKGFRVVAAEVKELSKETRDASESIATEIESIQAATTQAVASIAEISNTISQVDNIATIIASAVEEQNVTTAEISTNIADAAEGSKNVEKRIATVKEAAKKTTDFASTVKEVASGLAGQADELGKVLEQFSG